jgi:hypothetical protein
MEAERRRCIQVTVNVMDEVKPPKKWDPVIRPVPPPEGVVEQHDGHEHLRPARPRHEMQQTDPLALRPRHHRQQKQRMKKIRDRQRNATR